MAVSVEHAGRSLAFKYDMRIRPLFWKLRVSCIRFRLNRIKEFAIITTNAIDLSEKQYNAFILFECFRFNFKMNVTIFKIKQICGWTFILIYES